MIRACSACSGDYEDPDRTAATDADDDETIGDDGQAVASELTSGWETKPAARRTGGQSARGGP